MKPTGLPPKQGLYDPDFEHDACGAGFVVNIKGNKSHEIVRQALTILRNLAHRGACGADANSGDGAGILLQVPHRFLCVKARSLALRFLTPACTASARAFLPQDDGKRQICEDKLQKPSLPKKAKSFWAGARCRPTAERSAKTAIAAHAGHPAVLCRARR